MCMSFRAYHQTDMHVKASRKKSETAFALYSPTLTLPPHPSMPTNRAQDTSSYQRVGLDRGAGRGKAREENDCLIIESNETSCCHTQIVLQASQRYEGGKSALRAHTHVSVHVLDVQVQ